ncbi:MAG: hypothetical protein ACRDB0_05105 [Paraclostridium sp.]
MDILQEYDHLVNRFNKAFDYTWEEGDKMDLAFTKIIRRLSEIELMIKEG